MITFSETSARRIVSAVRAVERNGGGSVDGRRGNPFPAAQPFEVWMASDGHLRMQYGKVFAMGAAQPTTKSGGTWFNDSAPAPLDLGAWSATAYTVWIKYYHSRIASGTPAAPEIEVLLTATASVPADGSPDDAYDAIHIATITTGAVLTQLRSGNLTIQDARRGHYLWTDDATPPDHYELVTTIGGTDVTQRVPRVYKSGDTIGAQSGDDAHGDGATNNHDDHALSIADHTVYDSTSPTEGFVYADSANLPSGCSMYPINATLQHDTTGTDLTHSETDNKQAGFCMALIRRK